jgi:hypothetical protein
MCLFALLLVVATADDELYGSDRNFAGSYGIGGSYTPTPAPTASPTPNLTPPTKITTFEVAISGYTKVTFSVSFVCRTLCG